MSPFLKGDTRRVSNVVPHVWHIGGKTFGHPARIVSYDGTMKLRGFPDMLLSLERYSIW